MAKSVRWLCLAGAATALQAQAASQPYVQYRVLSMETANQIALEAARACAGQGYQVAAAVVDRSGYLLALARDPLAGPHSVEVARRKAYSSATFQAGTLELQQRSTMQALNHTADVLLIGGGLPVQVGGRFYGAVGVSGAPAKEVTGDVDEACARAGIDAVREALEFAE